MVDPKIINHPHGDRTFTSTLYYGADVRDSLKTLPDQSVQCVVTSPPYWGLRAYLGEGDPLKGSEIGAEPTPESYVTAMVDVFREVRRVLRDDGVLWLNLGDSYCSTDKWGGGGNNPGKHTVAEDGGVPSWAVREKKAKIDGVKPKDLVGIPWMVALALRADGWYLRSDVIWSKGSCMPESVTDRPTRSHEYVFLLTKSSRYFYDAEAVREEAVQADRVRADKIGGNKGDETHHSPGSIFEGSTTRNRRSVWTINSRPYKGAHFATMPPALAEVCIKAGSSEKGCCPTCGSAWERVIHNPGNPEGILGYKGVPNAAGTSGSYRKGNSPPEVHAPGGVRLKKGHQATQYSKARDTGTWSPTCKCSDHVPVPCTVLDPFSGSGTTGYVANRLGRHYVGTDLNTDYLPLAEARLLGMDPPEDEELTVDPDETASILDMFGGE